MTDHGRELVACTVCGARVRGFNLDRHLRKVHHLAATAKVSGRLKQAKAGSRTIPPRRFRVPSSTQPDGKAAAMDQWRKRLEAEQSPFQPNLDATKPYAHAYREHGRFGSHPSHDGFDDESGA